MENFGAFESTTNESNSWQNQRQNRKIVRFSIRMSDGLDPTNIGNETIVDLNAFDNMKLSYVHDEMLEHFDMEDDDYYYCSSLDDDQSELDMDYTLKQLRVRNGDVLILDVYRKRSKRSRIENETGVLSLICCTRIGALPDEPVKRVKVLVKANKECKELIDEVSSHWGRSGLKFKCGRIVLKEDKTFEEQGVEDESEIVVTGGRG